VGGCAPGEEPDSAVLEDEDWPDARIEAAEVVGHCWETEARTVEILAGPPVHGDVIGGAIGGYDLGEEPVGIAC